MRRDRKSEIEFLTTSHLSRQLLINHINFANAIEQIIYSQQAMERQIFSIIRTLESWFLISILFPIPFVGGSAVHDDAQTTRRITILPTHGSTSILIGFHSIRSVQYSLVVAALNTTNTSKPNKENRRKSVNMPKCCSSHAMPAQMSSSKLSCLPSPVLGCDQ